MLFNEFSNKTCYMLDQFDDGSFALTEKSGDSNKCFSYHLHLLQTIEQAIADNRVERVHFTLLRNLYEKTASFLGYPKWSEILPEDKQLYFSRIINFTSHSNQARVLQRERYGTQCSNAKNESVESTISDKKQGVFQIITAFVEKFKGVGGQL